jgi:glycosyltransferase involved in cell wall biosynthesis
MDSLKILHVLRAPVGGLFRHVIDLAREQIARGHHVGLVADSTTGGTRAEDIFRDLTPRLALGLTRVPMPRHAGLGDLSAVRHVRRRAAETGADIVHGHGAKGGVYARLLPAMRAVRAYSPHGGTLVFGDDTLIGKFYFFAERLLMKRGDLFLFESQFSADTFRCAIGEPKGVVRVVHNGVSPDEFEPVPPAADARDIVFLGELRMLKGVDVLLEALALLRERGRTATAVLIGDGPDRDVFKAAIDRLGLAPAATLLPPMAARKALTLGRVMVVPSRAESFPYVVLEAAAAAKPLVATAVGGIPEIFGPQSDLLIRADDAGALADSIIAALNDIPTAKSRAEMLQRRIGNLFTVNAMVDGVLSAYRHALGNRAPLSTS